MDRLIEVACYAGGLPEERPEAIVVDGARRRVEVVARWIEEGIDRKAGRRRWFTVRLADASEVTIYRDEALDLWFLRGA